MDETIWRRKILNRKLSTQLSAGFALIVFVTIALISVAANFLISHQFESYVEAQQKKTADNLASGLSDQYDSESKTWNLDYIHGFGMYALSDGYILKLYDAAGKSVWDAENHDMTLCHQIMNQLALQMKEQRPQWDGSLTTVRYQLTQNLSRIGYVDISYYSPYYFNENAFRFVDSLNQILLIIGFLSILGAVLAGILLAKRISKPIIMTTKAAREIAAGNNQIRLESKNKITELQELTQAINHMASSLEEQERLRRRLTGDVAHELRTPLANVSSLLEMMIEGIWAPTPERLQNCYDELKRIYIIVSDLEKLHQIEADNAVLKKEPVDLLKLSMTIKAAFEPQLSKKNLTCTIQGGPIFVSADPQRLHQAISNLLSNAAKYSNDGGTIVIRLKENKTEGIFSITDRGIGIAEKDLPLIFERFYRTDRSRSRKSGGAGIGLTIVQAIVQAHDGHISVESEEGKGSTFTMSIPKN